MKVKLLILVTIPKRVLCIWFVPHNFRNPGPFGCVLPRIGETMSYFYALALKNCFFLYSLRIWFFKSSMRIGAGTAREFPRTEDDVCINYIPQLNWIYNILRCNTKQLLILYLEHYFFFKRRHIPSLKSINKHMLQPLFNMWKGIRI